MVREARDNASIFAVIVALFAAPVIATQCWVNSDPMVCCSQIIIPCGQGTCVIGTSGAFTIAMADFAKEGQSGRVKLLESMQGQCEIYDQRCINGVCVTYPTLTMNCIDRETDTTSPKCLGQ